MKRLNIPDSVRALIYIMVFLLACGLADSLQFASA